MTWVLNITPAMWAHLRAAPKPTDGPEYHADAAFHGPLWLPFTGPVPEVECENCRGKGAVGWMGADYCYRCRGTGKRPIDRVALCVLTHFEPRPESLHPDGVWVVPPVIVASATVAEIVPIYADFADRWKAHKEEAPFASLVTNLQRLAVVRPDVLRSVTDITHLLDLANWSDKAVCGEFHGDDTYACGLPLPRFAMRLTSVTAQDPIPVTAPDTDQLWERTP